MSEDDVAEITQLLTRYVEAYLNADTAGLRAVFAEDAVMNGYVGDRLVTGAPDQFIVNVGKAPAIATLGGDPTYEIGAVEIRGNAASVTVQERGFGDKNFTDFIHLLKRDGAWKIVSKTFSTF